MKANVVYTASCSACDTPVLSFDVRVCDGCGAKLVRTKVLQNPFKRFRNERKVKTKQAQTS